MMEHVVLHYPRRPLARDGDDDMVLETAINGRATAIVAFNQGLGSWQSDAAGLKDYGSWPLTFGIEVLTPAACLRRL